MSEPCVLPRTRLRLVPVGGEAPDGPFDPLPFFSVCVSVCLLELEPLPRCHRAGRRGGGGPSAVGPAGKRGGLPPPLWCVHGALGSVATFPATFAEMMERRPLKLFLVVKGHRTARGSPLTGVQRPSFVSCPLRLLMMPSPSPMTSSPRLP